jgi:hypothetical protein
MKWKNTKRNFSYETHNEYKFISKDEGKGRRREMAKILLQRRLQ